MVSVGKLSKMKMYTSEKRPAGSREYPDQQWDVGGLGSHKTLYGPAIP